MGLAVAKRKIPKVTRHRRKCSQIKIVKGFLALMVANLVLHTGNPCLISNSWQIVAVKASRIDNHIKVRFKLVLSWRASKLYFCAPYHILDQTQLVIAYHSLESDIDAASLLQVNLHVLAIMQNIVVEIKTTSSCETDHHVLTGCPSAYCIMFILRHPFESHNMIAMIIA